jgi:anti-sigma factor (TIGR02949 family)
MEHGKNCHELIGELSEYVDGELAAELCEELEHHLADCENCRVVVDTLRKTIYLIHATAEQPDVPVDVRERLYHRLELDDYLKK